MLKFFSTAQWESRYHVEIPCERGPARGRTAGNQENGEEKGYLRELLQGRPAGNGRHPALRCGCAGEQRRDRFPAG